MVTFRRRVSGRGLSLTITCCGALLANCSSAGPNAEQQAGAGGVDHQAGMNGSPVAGSAESHAGGGGLLTSGGSAGSPVIPTAGSSARGGSGGGTEAMPAGGGGSAGGSGGAHAGGGGGPPCPSGVVFCDDFESYAVGAPPAGRWQAEGKAPAGFDITVDPVHPYSGTKAYHVAVDYTGDGYAELYMAAKSGIIGNTAYARFMMYQTSWERPHPDTPPGIHALLFVLGNVAVDLDFSPSVFTLELGHDGFGSMAHMGPKPILNKWICIKAQLGPTLALTVDGQVLSVPAGGGTGFDSLKLGISTYRKFSTDFWIDDLVVDTKPVECP